MQVVWWAIEIIGLWVCTHLAKLVDKWLLRLLILILLHVKTRWKALLLLREESWWHLLSLVWLVYTSVVSWSCRAGKLSLLWGSRALAYAIGDSWRGCD